MSEIPSKCPVDGDGGIDLGRQKTAADETSIQVGNALPEI